MAVAGTGTAADQLGVVPLASLAATPRAVGEGKVWLLLTSAVLADTPWLPSLLGFAVVLVGVLCVLPVRQVIVAAVAGQFLSTAVVYGAIGAARLVDGQAFSSVLGVQDYGLSAMIAAWIGAVAGVAWGRQSPLRVVAGCLACLGVGLACRPTLTFLDSEHVVAFAIGIAVVRVSLSRFVLPVRRAAVAVTGLAELTHAG